MFSNPLLGFISNDDLEGAETSVREEDLKARSIKKVKLGGEDGSDVSSMDVMLVQKLYADTLMKPVEPNNTCNAPSHGVDVTKKNEPTCTTMVVGDETVQQVEGPDNVENSKEVISHAVTMISSPSFVSEKIQEHVGGNLFGPWMLAKKPIRKKAGLKLQEHHRINHYGNDSNIMGSIIELVVLRLRSD
ncbi:hypothetical protein RIF29_29501 [Crotalaria pallida]|uniref:Uncharacterized protein n=1 Tax=Crotalaria pallida TaxID=3830 RepID=A0AAN9ELG8_CROPI